MCEYVVAAVQRARGGGGGYFPYQGMWQCLLFIDRSVMVMERESRV
jgi:hypothetical protein